MRNYKIEQRLIFCWDDRPFDGQGSIECVVTEIHPDHVIAVGDGMTLWIDDDTENQFHEITPEISANSNN